MFGKIKKCLIYLYSKKNFRHKWNNEIKNINKKKNIYEKVKLTVDQEEEIKEFFVQNYGTNFSNKWHRLYQSYMGKYDKTFFPEILFSTKLEDVLNPPKISHFLEDKSLVELLYGNVDNLIIPKTILLNCSGIYYSGNRNIISYSEAVKSLENTDELVFKTTIDSSSGRSIMICKFKNGIDENSGMKVEEILRKYNVSFIAQECIKNCSELKKLNPTSLNTFRVITYIANDKLFHVPLALRIGRNGNRVDNAHAGGIFIGVSDKGILCNKAFSEWGDVFEEHPDTHVRFKNYHIPKVEEMIKIAYKCHGLTPHLKMISWDFSIDENGSVVLIEMGGSGQSIWFPQMANGCGAFGENTSYMYELVRKKHD